MIEHVNEGKTYSGTAGATMAPAGAQTEAQGWSQGGTKEDRKHEGAFTTGEIEDNEAQQKAQVVVQDQTEWRRSMNAWPLPQATAGSGTPVPPLPLSVIPARATRVCHGLLLQFHYRVSNSRLSVPSIHLLNLHSTALPPPRLGLPSGSRGLLVFPLEMWSSRPGFTTTIRELAALCH